MVGAIEKNCRERQHHLIQMIILLELPDWTNSDGR